MNSSILEVLLMWTALALFFDCLLSCCFEPDVVAKEPTADDDPQPQAVPARSPIYALHDDVVYYLAKTILPINDAVALVLTCRSVYHAANGKMVLQELQHQPVACRADFLQRLEPDFPNHVLCYRCAVFHSQYQDTCGFRGNEATKCDKGSGSTSYGDATHRLQYRQVKEIANLNRFGPSYGRSLDKIMLQGSLIRPLPHREITSICRLDLKWVKRNGTFALTIRRNLQVEYQYTSLKSRESANVVIWGGTRHAMKWLEDDDLMEELLPSCYRCGHCGAERLFSITYLPYKPEYALIRSTLWESVGLCRNSPDDLWDHICSAFHEEGELIPISLRDLEHHYAFIDDMPPVPDQELPDQEVPSQEFDGSILRKLPDLSVKYFL